jgi:prevent-host-death family protein
LAGAYVVLAVRPEVIGGPEQNGIGGFSPEKYRDGKRPLLYNCVHPGRRVLPDAAGTELMPKPPAPVLRNRIPLTEARASLGRLVREVHALKRQVVLERGGVPMAALIPVGELEDWLEARDAEAAAVIAESRADRAAGRTRSAAELLAELDEEG